MQFSFVDDIFGTMTYHKGKIEEEIAAAKELIESARDPYNNWDNHLDAYHTFFLEHYADYLALKEAKPDKDSPLDYETFKAHYVIDSI